jgi:hypothetical protein
VRVRLLIMRDDETAESSGIAIWDHSQPGASFLETFDTLRQKIIERGIEYALAREWEKQ